MKNIRRTIILMDRSFLVDDDDAKAVLDATRTGQPATVRVKWFIDDGMASEESWVEFDARDVVAIVEHDATETHDRARRIESWWVTPTGICGPTPSRHELTES